MEETPKLEEAARFFKIGTITNYKPTEIGIGNENYFVQTTSGEFVLRRLWEQTIEGLQNEIAIQKQLAAVNIPTAQLMQGENDSYYFQADDQVITVSRMIEGHHPKVIDAQLARAVGSTLARFHQAVTSLPVELPNWLNKDKARINLERIEKTHPLTNEISMRLAATSDLFDQDLPTGIIHGDLYPGNLLLKPDGQLVIFDFETAERNLLIIDLARSLLSMDQGKEFIEGYEEVRKLTKGERQNLQKAKLFTSGAVAAWLVDRNQNIVAKEILDNATKGSP